MPDTPRLRILHRCARPTLLLLAACATQPAPSGGGDNLPNAGVGPFRALATAELGNLRSGPLALDDDVTFARDPSLIDLDGNPKTFAIAGYFGAAVAQGGTPPAPSDPTRAIVRFDAEDGRSFDRTPEEVLHAELPWEGGVMGGPSIVRASPSFGSRLFLYYAAQGGVGLAQSEDGHTFTRFSNAPVLGPARGGWENGNVPTSPGVVVFPDGSFRMFYEVTLAEGDSAIGEARSQDGRFWERVGEAPALAPRRAAAGQEAPYDAGAVGSPCPILGKTGEGKPVLLLYHGARDAAGASVIGLAARFESEGAGPQFTELGGRFERALGPVFGTSKPLGTSEPALLAYEGFLLLFASAPSAATRAHPAVAVGVAPATATLPAPTAAP
jgi:hypothetical protein